MSTLSTLTRAAVDAAEPVQFPSRRSAVVHLSFRGVAVDVTLAEASAAEVEKLVDSLLGRDGWAAPAAPGAGARAPARPAAAEPVYQPDGTACCPTHLRPLKGPNQWGKLYCTAKDDAGQYCKFTTRA